MDKHKNFQNEKKSKKNSLIKKKHLLKKLPKEKNKVYSIKT